MKKPTLKQLFLRTLNEVHNMHHNANLGWRLPDLENKDEETLFWNIIDEQIGKWMDELQQQIQNKFNREVVLYVHGPEDTTIAPGSYARNQNFINWYDSIRGTTKYYDHTTVKGLDDYNDLFLIWKICTFINSQLKVKCDGVADWWEVYKSDNCIGDLIKKEKAKSFFSPATMREGIYFFI